MLQLSRRSRWKLQFWFKLRKWRLGKNEIENKDTIDKLSDTKKSFKHEERFGIFETDYI